MAEEKKACGCAICKHAKVYPDPDPNDWFCDDDVKVLCTKVPLDVNGEPKGGNNQITCACRPYMVTRECSYTPDWCPLDGQPEPRTL